MILGLVEPTSGTIRVDGIDVARASHAQMRAAPPDAARVSGSLRRAQSAHEGAGDRYRAVGDSWHRRRKLRIDAAAAHLRDARQ